MHGRYRDASPGISIALRLLAANYSPDGAEGPGEPGAPEGPGAPLAPLGPLGPGVGIGSGMTLGVEVLGAGAGC